MKSFNILFCIIVTLCCKVCYLASGNASLLISNLAECMCTSVLIYLTYLLETSDYYLSHQKPTRLSEFLVGPNGSAVLERCNRCTWLWVIYIKCLFHAMSAFFNGYPLSDDYHRSDNHSLLKTSEASQPEIYSAAILSLLSGIRS